MSNLFVHVGNGEFVSARHALAIIQPGSVTAKRRVSAARKLGQYIDTSHGKGIKSYVLLDENTVVASHISAKTLAGRFMEEFTETGDNEGYNANVQAHIIASEDPDDDFLGEEDEEDFEDEYEDFDESNPD